MIHPSTKLLFINEQIGHGVVATQLIPAGTIVWTMDQLDRIIDPSEFLGKEDLYEELLDTYCYKNHEGKYVLCWDYSKYMNHSFRPNTISTAYYFDIAIRDIQKGEEVTCDYGYLNVEEPLSSRRRNRTQSRISRRFR
ncbi:MAG: SET domain-containing protein [Bacteroidia bacterium]